MTLPATCMHVLHDAKSNEEIIVNIHKIQSANNAESKTLGQHTKVVMDDKKSLHVREDAHAIIDTMEAHARKHREQPALPWEGEPRF